MKHATESGSRGSFASRMGWWVPEILPSLAGGGRISGELEIRQRIGTGAIRDAEDGKSAGFDLPWNPNRSCFANSFYGFNGYHVPVRYTSSLSIFRLDPPT